MLALFERRIRLIEGWRLSRFASRLTALSIEREGNEMTATSIYEIPCFKSTGPEDSVDLFVVYPQKHAFDSMALQRVML